MKKYLLTGLLAVLFSVAGSMVSAHHSAAPFDFMSTVDVEGTVKKFRVMNPHSVIILEVTDSERGTRDIEFEGMSASTFYRAGYTKNSVLVGDTISINIAPRFTGEDGGFVMSFITSAGEDIGFKGP